MTVFYYKNFKKEIASPVDIILSPEFYWIKKIEIPVKNIYTAKKIAKNLFDLDENYIYDAIKIKDNYFAIAIKKNLDIKIPKKYIKSIRIAQSELFEYDKIKIDETHGLKKIDDILFCFPQGEGENLEEILKKIKLSKYKFNIYDRVEIPKSDIITAALIFIMLNIGFFVQIYGYKKEIEKINMQKEKLSKYNLPLNTYQLNSILSALKETDKQQNKIKKSLEYIANSPVKKFIKLSYDNNEFEVIIDTKKNLNSYFEKKFQIVSFSTSPYKAVLRIKDE